MAKNAFQIDLQPFPTHVGVNRFKQRINRRIKAFPHARGGEPAESPP